MVENIIDKIEKEISNYIDKKITIIQDGFLQSTYQIQTFEYNIENEILCVTDKRSINYLKINLNQIYKFEKNKQEIKLYIDNDTIITIQKDRL